VDWRALPPPCGQLTRCFSAVAELLVCSSRPQEEEQQEQTNNKKKKMSSDMGSVT